MVTKTKTEMIVALTERKEEAERVYVRKEGGKGG